MPASVQIVEKNGAGGTATDKTGGTVRFKNADNAAVDLNDPLVRPGAGSDWSFEKWLRLNVAGGSYSQITNIRAYCDGASGFGAGVNLWWRAAAAYAQPVEPTSPAGFADGFGYSAASPLVLGAGPFSGAGEKGDHLVMALEVQAAAAGGMLPAESVTLAWDEI
jgi:hypothetical protein